jgi:hypothetical protein
MTWPEFLVGFVAATSIAVFLARSYFARCWFRLGQVTLFIMSLCFLLDYPAEHRRIWSFHHTVNIMILDTPIENHIFVGACVVDIMIIYLTVKARLRSTTWK